MILLIDNYDSFTYNLVQYISEILPPSTEIVVHRNDVLSTCDISQMSPSHIIVSPGPCTPHEAGCSMAVVRELSGLIPILGVCLGHQSIAAAFGGNVVRAPFPVHGKVSMVEHGGDGLFAGIPSPFGATRYHSLIVEAASLPDCLVPTAWTDGLIMAMEHRSHKTTLGVQFHPESIMTTHGRQLLSNFFTLGKS